MRFERPGLLTILKQFIFRLTFFKVPRKKKKRQKTKLLVRETAQQKPFMDTVLQMSNCNYKQNPVLNPSATAPLSISSHPPLCNDVNAQKSRLG